MTYDCTSMHACSLVRAQCYSVKLTIMYYNYSNTMVMLMTTLYHFSFVTLIYMHY